MWALPVSLHRHESRVTSAFGVTRCLRHPMLSAKAHNWLYGRFLSPEANPGVLYPDLTVFEDRFEEVAAERVWVAPHNRSRTEWRVPQELAEATLVTNDRYRAEVHRVHYGSNRYAKQVWPDGDDMIAFGLFNDPGRTESAMALMHPGYFTHGLRVVSEESGLVDGVLNRPVRRLLLESTPEAAATSWEGTDIRKPVLREAQAVELVVDEEFDAILSWIGLLEGQVYARTRFEEIAFGVNIDPDHFDLNEQDAHLTTDH